MAGLATRLLVATIDGAVHASSTPHAERSLTKDGPFHAEVHASSTAIEIAIAIRGRAAKLALGARDPAGQRWRDGWLLEIVQGEERWLLEPGAEIEITDVRRAAIVAQLQIRRRWLVAERAEDNVALADVACHRYTRQSSVVARDDKAAATEPVPWMTPTRAESAPWWEIDLGRLMAIAWMRVDLASLPAGARLTCFAFGHPSPAGVPPAGSVVRELARDELHGDDDGQVYFTVDDPVVARYVRVQAHAPEAVALAITATEIQAAPLHGETLAETMRRAFVLHADRALCLTRTPEGAYVAALTYAEIGRRASALARGLAAVLEPRAERIVVAVMLRNRPEWLVADLAILQRGYVSVALAPDDADDRLAQIFALARPTCVVVEASNAARVARLAPAAKCVIVDGDGALSYDALVATGEIEVPPPAPRDEDDLYAVLFTSGSTGMPKGAMRSYRTFHAMLASYEIGHSPRHLSFQPLSHLSERMYTPAILINGGCIAYARGGAHLLDELAALEPTTVGSVPRLWEVLHARYADRPAAARARLGTRLLAVSVGSAPCSAEVLAFLRHAFADVWVSEGYGTTELGTIAVDGVISKDVAVKLVNGEIWVRSPHVIAGYLGDATTTVDADGFVATGDLGAHDADGRVRVIGRVRNTIKLAQGEFVAIDRIEAILAAAPGVDQIFIHAGHGAPHLAAVVVPREPAGDVAAALRAHAAAVGLAAYEVPAEIVVETEPFTVANGLLTASGKLARPALIEKYGALLTATRPTREDLGEALDLGSRIAAIASRIARREIALDEPLGAGVGVDSLAAAEILAGISEALARDVPLGWWFESRTLRELADRLARPDASRDAANLALAREDLALPTPATRPVQRGTPRRVLVTGATGFLGAFLVEALRARDIEVTCLVRARDDAQAQTRLDEALARRRLTARARAITGDLAALAIDVDVDAVVHAGATVSWLASYEALRAPNVLGTHALLGWAAARGIAFHHVSTISTVPPDGDEQSALTFEGALASTPYGLSKWIAEHHARAVAASIYRPAMIAPDTQHGIGNPDDYLNRYMAGVRELGVYIDRDDAIIDMTPVDFVANAIAACVANGRIGETLHLANVEQSLTYAALGRALVAAGVAAKPVTYDAFRAALHAATTSRLHALAAFFPPAFSLGMGPWPCRDSLAVLATLGVERPRIDAALIARYVSAQRDERR